MPDLKTLQFIVDMIYGNRYDKVILQCLKNRKTAEEAFSYGGIGEQVEALKAAYLAEEKKANADNGEQETNPEAEEEALPEDHEGDNETSTFVDNETSTFVDDDSTTAYWKKYADMLVNAKCDWIVEDTEAKTAAAIRGTKAGQVKPGDGEYLGLLYDTKTAGESATQPRTRMPPLKAPHHTKMLQAALKARHDLYVPDAPDDLQVPPRDLYQWYDSFKRGQERLFFDPFAQAERKLDVKRKLYYVCYSEDSVRVRLDRQRDSLLDNVELLHVITRDEVKLVLRKGNLYPGTNQSSFIGPVVVRAGDWKMTFAKKKIVLGARRVDVGGKDIHAKPHKRLDTDVEPLSFHGQTVEFHSEILKRFNLIGMIELCTLDNNLAMACMLQRLPYAGVCCTQAHANLCREKLVQLVYKAFTDETMEGLYDPAAVLALKAENEQGGGEEEEPEAAPKAKAKGKAKGKSRSAKKKAEAAAKAGNQGVQEKLADLIAKATAKGGAGNAGEDGEEEEEEADPEVEDDEIE